MNNETTLLGEVSSSLSLFQEGLMENVPIIVCLTIMGLCSLFLITYFKRTSEFYGYQGCGEKNFHYNNDIEICEGNPEEEYDEEFESEPECVAPVESAPKIKSRYTPRCPNCWGYLDEENVCRVCKMVIKQ